MNHSPRTGCNPGRGCFNCPFRDCIASAIHTPPTPEETAMRAAGNKRKAGRRTSFGSICMVIIGK